MEFWMAAQKIKIMLIHEFRKTSYAYNADYKLTKSVGLFEGELEGPGVTGL